MNTDMLTTTYILVGTFLFIFSMATQMQGDKLKDRIFDSLILASIWPVVSIGVFVYALYWAYKHIRNALK